MQRDPLATSKARKAERKADEKSGLITIKPVKLEMPATSAGGGGGGFKRGGFRSAFGGGSGGGGVGVGRGEADGSGNGNGNGNGEGEDEDEGEGVGKAGTGVDRVEEVVVGKAESGESESEDEGEEYYDPRRPTGCFAACPGR
ncbi:MAG: hypothetical protein M1830_010539 [Pleopsidium flavum]|nr:MAG: hypothetical protein M1830_010539 [Pleopsidium flavum]